MKIAAISPQIQVYNVKKPNSDSHNNTISNHTAMIPAIYYKSPISFGYCTPHQGVRREVSQDFMEQVMRNIEINRNKTRLELLELRNEASREVTAFLLSFSNKMLNSAEYPVEEFFMAETEFQAQKEIKNNTIGRGTDYHNSGYIEDRETIREAMSQSTVLNDSVLSLISANNLKKFKPKNENLDDSQLDLQYSSIIKSTKEALALSTEQALENGNKFYSDDDMDDIATLVKIIRTTDGADFGDDFDRLLKKVINSQKHMEKKKIELEVFYQREISAGSVLTDEKREKLLEMKKTVTGKKLEAVEFMLKYNREITFCRDELTADQMHTRHHLLEHSHDHVHNSAPSQIAVNNQVTVTPHIHNEKTHVHNH